jgi:hypothetical protein
MRIARTPSVLFGPTLTTSERVTVRVGGDGSPVFARTAGAASLIESTRISTGGTGFDYNKRAQSLSPWQLTGEGIRIDSESIKSRSCDPCRTHEKLPRKCRRLIIGVLFRNALIGDSTRVRRLFVGKPSDLTIARVGLSVPSQLAAAVDAVR